MHSDRVHFLRLRLICLYKKGALYMAYEEKQPQAARTHGISMENRSRLSVTGVEDVESFDENLIVMNTVAGDLIVRGSGLHIGRISLDAGQLSVEGSISELSYEDSTPAGGLWRRLFG